ncbi:uncharacterized protein LOC129581178 isoform X2 [Paramacrobiotus metropolitanus]|uniref:uncharacterized protein LOC129581178 isoform X2 n=1 Tax=Paramacrobiotus metropolitanus TaxID=2943436 RepID=UPI002445C93A|nr:uncharacterized protein LOC129581178 isoform X2 [Paramacrobiotus metropolitanus]
MAYDQTPFRNGIIIANFCEQKEHVVDYPFVIIRGYVTHPAGSFAKTTAISNDRNAFNAVWSVCRRHFRGVVPLALGSNAVKFTVTLSGSDDQRMATLLKISYRTAQNDCFVMPLYVICRDANGTFQAEADEDDSPHSAVRRIATGAGLLQSFTAEKLVDEGYPRKTFRLSSDIETGLPKCTIFRTRLKIQELYAMKDVDIWRHLKKELAGRFPSLKGRCKFLAFLADTRYQRIKDDQPVPQLYEDVLHNVKGQVALGGSRCLYTWPENVADLQRYLTDERPINQYHFMDDSAYRGTRWACYSTTLGAACHELGHAFDLGHTPVGIMARGFDNIYKEFTVERPTVFQNRLSSEPTGDSRLLHLPVTVVPAPREMFVTVKVINKSPEKSERKMEVVSTNPSFSAENATQGGPLKKSSSEKNLFARVSGSFRSKLFSSKHQDDKPEEMPSHRKYSLESPMPDDAFSTSSCAISLCEPERSISNASTRPSSTLSAAKKARNWHKRLSGSFAGLKSPTESYSEAVDRTVHPEATHTINYITPLNSVVTKHYSKHVSYQSSMGDVQVTQEDIHKSATLPARMEETGAHDHRRKSPWKRLFNRKKKDPLKEEELDAKETKDISNKSPDKVDYIVESRTGAETVIFTSGPTLEPTDPSHSDGLNSVDGLTFESEDESCRPKSPDSFEEFSFKFSKEDCQPVQATLPQHVVYKIHQLEPAHHAVANDAELPDHTDTSSTPEKKENKSAKPQPTVRTRSTVSKDEQMELAKTDAVEANIDGHHDDTETLIRDKTMSGKAAKSLEEKRAVRRSASADMLDTKAATMKRVAQEEPEKQKPARKSLPAERKPLLRHSNAEKRSTINTSQKPTLSTKAKENQAAEASVENGKKQSKLKYPLRTAPGCHPASNLANPRPKIQNRIPTQSTQSSRNKENIPARKKPASENPSEAKKAITKRRSFRRRNSGRGQKSSAKSKTTYSPTRDTIRTPSSRLDFTQVHVAQTNSVMRRRSSSRDTIGNLGNFINHSAAGTMDSESKDLDEWESLEGTSSPVSMPSNCSTSGDTEHSGCSSGGQRGGVKGKQNASSLINTPSGISVMEDLDVPHRLPIPRPIPVKDSCVVAMGDDAASPSWTRSCATLLNYHKWFNVNQNSISASCLDDDVLNKRHTAVPELSGDTLIAPGGLRLVELRDMAGNVLHYWEFIGDKDVPTTFRIGLPLNATQASVSDYNMDVQQSKGKMTVVALDTYGNLLQRSLTS